MDLLLLKNTSKSAVSVKNRKRKRQRKNKNVNNSNNQSFDGLSINVPKLIKRSNCPEAPFNTTQFLIDEHASDDLVSSSVNGEISSNNSSEFNDSTLDYLMNDFNSIYDEVHCSDLLQKSKNELIKYCFTLEQKIENLKNELCVLKSFSNTVDSQSIKSDNY